MCRIHHAIIVVMLLGAFLGLIPGKVHAQNYVFGTASYAAPGLTLSSPPLGNVPMITADFNGDGIPDLAVLGANAQSTQVISIFLGKPDGTFAPRVDYPVQASGFTVGDFNGDGKLDIVAVSNTYNPVADLLLGNGDGTFQPAAPLNLNIENGAYSEVASADFNGDGKLDLVVLTPNFGTGATMAVLLGNGDGTFEAPVTYQVPVAPYLSIGDFNGDGKPDIAVAGGEAGSYPAGSEVSVLVNNGDGTFQSPENYSITGGIEALTLADLNGDGKLDLVVPTGGLPAGVSVLLGNGDGTFASPVSYLSNLLSYYFASVAVADFNGDGKLDLAMAPTNVTALDTNAVAILLGNGDGTFQNSPLIYSAGLEPAGVLALDMNGDGKPDLAVLGGYFVGPYYSVTVLINQGGGSFPHPTAYPALQYPWTALAGDFNGDGKPDIAVASITPSASGQDTGGVVSVFLNNGGGTFQPRIDSPTPTNPLIMAPGDFNGDGKLDLVVVEGTPSGELLSTWLGNGDGTFQNNISQSLANYVPSLAVGDFNHDGKLDVAAVIDGTNAISIFLGIGDGTFSAPVPYATGGTPGYGLTTADFNGDGNLDLAVDTSQGISILLGKGNGTFGPYTAILPGEYLLALGDFNGDGKPDLAITTDTNLISVALGDGDGTFQQASGYQLPSILSSASPTVGDFNGDGNLDIAFTSQSAYVVTILFGNGDGTFSHHLEFGTAQVPALVAADFNGDGALDLAMTDVTNQAVSVFLSSPVAALYPSSLSFGNLPVGTPGPEQNVTMSNPSPVPITLSSIGASGDFSETNNCGSVLASDANCPVSVTFTPTTEGIRYGALVFTDSVPGSPQSLSLAGTGAGPAVQLAPSSLVFTGQPMGTTSPAQSIMLTNTGNGTLTISSIVVSGDFAQTNTCGSSVNAGANCTIRVTFTPAATGSRTGTLTITDDAGNSPQTVSLTGTGTAPSVSLSTASVSFSNQAVGTTSAASAVTVTNSGTASLTFTSIAATGDFAVAASGTSCTTSASVPASGSCVINLTFTPTAIGARSGSLTLTDNASGSPQSVSLSGTGTEPVVSLSSPLSFSPQMVGTTSNSQTVTLTNSGNANLTLTAIGATGPFAIATSGTTCSTSSPVAAAATCTVAVTFTPKAGGAASGSLSFSDNAPNSPQTVALSGTGQDFSLAPPSGSSTSATVAPGSPATYTLSVGGEGGLSGPVNFTCTGAPSEATGSVSPNPATAGSSATNVTVTVTTTAPSITAPRSRPLPPVAPLSPGMRGLWILVLALAALVWVIRCRNQPSMSPWRSAILPLIAGLLVILALAACGGGGSTSGPAPNPGTPAGTYSLTVTGTTGSGSSTLSHSVTLSLTVS